eukprot:2335117-Rhodomonas_salina.1
MRASCISNVMFPLVMFQLTCTEQWANGLATTVSPSLPIPDQLDEWSVVQSRQCLLEYAARSSPLWLSPPLRSA